MDTASNESLINYTKGAFVSSLQIKNSRPLYIITLYKTTYNYRVSQLF